MIKDIYIDNAKFVITNVTLFNEPTVRYHIYGNYKGSYIFFYYYAFFGAKYRTHFTFRHRILKKSTIHKLKKHLDKRNNNEDLFDYNITKLYKYYDMNVPFFIDRNFIME